MKKSQKLVITIIVIFAIAAGALALQAWSGRLMGRSVSAQEMEALIGTLPPQQQMQLAQNEAQRKELAKAVKQILSIGHEAEQLGYDKKEEIASQLELQRSLALAQEYQRRAQEKQQSAEPTEEEIKAYEQKNPNYFDEFLKKNPRFAQVQGPQRDQLKKEFTQLMVLAEKAKAEKLDQDPGIQMRLMLERNNALADAYVRDLREKITVDDAEVQKYYDEHKQEYEQVRARHVLISTRPAPDAKPDAPAIDKEAARKKAEEVLAQVKAGKDFATLANQYSDEPAAKRDKNGGDLGFFSKGQMVPQFDAAVFTMQPGEISDIVETSFGFHVIKVEERRVAPLEDVKEEISAKLKQEKFKQQLDELVAKSNINVEENFKVNAPAGGIQQLPGAGGLPPGHPSVPPGNQPE